MAANPTAAYAAETQIAIAAIRRACVLTASVFNKLVKQETLTKDDKSPVTVGDFSAQAAVNTMLNCAFPDDPIVGEEDAADLRVESGKILRKRIIELTNETLTAELEAREKEEWGVGPKHGRTADELLDAIDRGNYNGGRTGRVWTLDPIDGPKGFLCGEQYAVCLALIVDARARHPSGPRGCIFVAVRGHGAFQLPLENPFALTIPTFTGETLNFLESVEKAHAKLSFNERVGQVLGVRRGPTRMDSQAKYCSLARSGRWGCDHAVGAILVEEAGGIISDGRGEPLDFGLGRTLGENFGAVAAGKDVHAKVIAAIKEAKAEEEAQTHL
ncbi:hypothetical protein V8D89_010992 [Ganoderma adspersum]